MCTCITYTNGDFYFGRNLDLEYSFGETGDGDAQAFSVFLSLFGKAGDSLCDDRNGDCNGRVSAVCGRG